MGINKKTILTRPKANEETIGPNKAPWTTEIQARKKPRLYANQQNHAKRSKNSREAPSEKSKIPLSHIRKIVAELRTAGSAWALHNRKTPSIVSIVNIHYETVAIRRNQKPQKSRDTCNLGIIILEKQAPSDWAKISLQKRPLDMFESPQNENEIKQK